MDGPRGQIAPENPVRLDAARQAAVDAQRKARAYADGVGARLGAPLTLTEPDQSRLIQRAGGWRAAASHDGPAIETGEHEVSASIQVTFALQTNPEP